MTKHTQSEWIVDGTWIYSLEHAGWHKGVEQFRNRFCTQVQRGSNTPNEELEANAKLMGTAPKLLAALERLTDAAFARDNTMGDPCRLIECRAEVDAAIRQAREVMASLDSVLAAG